MVKNTPETKDRDSLHGTGLPKDNQAAKEVLAAQTMRISVAQCNRAYESGSFFQQVLEEKVFDKSVKPKSDRLRGHNLKELYLCMVKRNQSAEKLVCCLLALSQKHSIVCFTLAKDQRSNLARKQQFADDTVGASWKSCRRHTEYENIFKTLPQSVNHALICLDCTLCSCAPSEERYQPMEDACFHIHSMLSSASVRVVPQEKIGTLKDMTETGKLKVSAETKKSELDLILNTAVTSLYSVCKVTEPSIQMCPKHDTLMSSYGQNVLSVFWFARNVRLDIRACTSGGIIRVHVSSLFKLQRPL